MSANTKEVDDAVSVQGLLYQSWWRLDILILIISLLRVLIINSENIFQNKEFVAKVNLLFTCFILLVF